MQEIVPGLYLHPGKPPETLLYALGQNPEWSVVSAAKYPWYAAIKPKPEFLDPEYYVLERGRRLYMNILDTKDSKYFSHALIDPALLFIGIQLMNERKVLVHCDSGEHRSPTIAMLYLSMVGTLPNIPDEAVKVLKHLYPHFNVHSESGAETGIYMWVKTHWSEYVD